MGRCQSQEMDGQKNHYSAEELCQTQILFYYIIFQHYPVILIVLNNSTTGMKVQCLKLTVSAMRLKEINSHAPNSNPTVNLGVQ